jgi:hypothetical protein
MKKYTELISNYKIKSYNNSNRVIYHHCWSLRRVKVVKAKQIGALVKKKKEN